jgi:hypothetical protein
MVLYKLYVFCFDKKFKMAATEGGSVTLGARGKMLVNAASLKKRFNSHEIFYDRTRYM